MDDLFGRFDFLILPCRDNASPDHWQSHWQAALPNMTRVEQDDWVTPTYGAWSVRLDTYLARATKPVVLIAHSLGTSLVMRWSQEGGIAGIAGGFMVAPSDRGPADIWPGARAAGFAPMVLDPIPFPTMVLCSRNDPFVAYDRAELFARAWGSALVDCGTQGHMGNTAGLGLWPFGLVHFGAFLGSLLR